MSKIDELREATYREAKDLLTKENIEKLVDDKTKVIFAETVANPTIVVLDFEKIADIAKRNQVLFMV